MSADGFAVDYRKLAEVAQSLADLRGELAQGADAVAPLLGTLSHDGLRRELAAFAKNWSDRKADITKRLDQVAGFARAAAIAYRSADEGGAAAFSGAGGTGRR